MKTLLFTIAILVSISAFSQDYKISRYEQKSDQLFICINSTVAPVYVEHFFTEGQRSTPDSIKVTIEGLIADLQIKADDYVVPEPIVSKVQEAKNIQLSETKIAKFKADKLKAITDKKKAEADKILEDAKPKEEIIKEIIK